MLREGKLSAGHARTILGIEGSENQINAANAMVERGLSVREAEDDQRGRLRESGSVGERKSRRAVDPRIRRVEEELQRYFGTLVKLKGSEKGSVIIKYYSMEDLNRILDILRIEI